MQDRNAGSTLHEMLGGGRNGRQWTTKWGLAVLLFLSFVYVFYLYRGVRSVLQDKEDELESLDALQNRMGEQLQSAHYTPTHATI